ncbi:MAG: hypoxanthine phosphoribosyltransferase [Candidatus Dasytiphilus stammeri]
MVNSMLTENKIHHRIKTLGESISEYYKNSNFNLVIIGILRGAFIFIADLCREITISHQLDFMCVSSYGNSISSSYDIKIIKDLELQIGGKHALLVDDIIDSGYSLIKIYELLMLRKPKSLLICTLLDKPICRSVKIEPSWIGFTISDEFVVGYGMDYAQNYRHFPYIGKLV